MGSGVPPKWLKRKMSDASQQFPRPNFILAAIYEAYLVSLNVTTLMAPSKQQNVWSSALSQSSLCKSAQSVS